MSAESDTDADVASLLLTPSSAVALPLFNAHPSQSLRDPSALSEGGVTTGDDVDMIVITTAVPHRNCPLGDLVGIVIPPPAPSRGHADCERSSSCSSSDAEEARGEDPVPAGSTSLSVLVEHMSIDVPTDPIPMATPEHSVQTSSKKQKRITFDSDLEIVTPIPVVERVDTPPRAMSNAAAAQLRLEAESHAFILRQRGSRTTAATALSSSETCCEPNNDPPPSKPVPSHTPLRNSIEIRQTAAPTDRRSVLDPPPRVFTKRTLRSVSPPGSSATHQHSALEGVAPPDGNDPPQTAPITVRTVKDPAATLAAFQALAAARRPPTPAILIPHHHLPRSQDSQSTEPRTPNNCSSQPSPTGSTHPCCSPSGNNSHRLSSLFTESHRSSFLPRPSATPVVIKGRPAASPLLLGDVSLQTVDGILLAEE